MSCSPNLRVTHETFAQTNSGSMGSECPVTVIFGDSVHVRRIARLDRIALCSFLWEPS